MNAGKLKKYFASMLIGTLCVSMLGACGSGTEKGSEAKPEKEKSDHLVMAWWGNQVRNEKTQANGLFFY